MRDNLLDGFYLLALRRRRAVLLIMAAFTLACGLLIPGLKISSSYNDLVSGDDPEHARFLAFMEEFGAADDLVVVLEGEPEVLASAAESFAREFEAEKDWVESVFFRVDPRPFLLAAPLFASDSVLEEALAFVAGERELIAEMGRLDGLPAVLLAASGLTGPASAGSGPAPEEAAEALRGLGMMLSEWSAWIRDPGRSLDFERLLGDLSGGEAGQLASGGYLRSRDGRLFFLFVRPCSTSDEISFLEPFVRAAREACERVFQRRPELRSALKVSFTGMPAHALSEMEIISSDVARTSAISVVLVLLLLLLGLRSPRNFILAAIPLACGMIVTLGLTRLTVGRLNLISSSFLAVLFGIGIDFGIYLIQRAAEERGKGASPDEAVRISVVSSGRSVLTGGLVTGLAFLAVGFSGFLGFSELGVIAGMGVLAVLLTTFLMLPELLLILPPSHLGFVPAAPGHAGPPRRAVLRVLAAGGLLLGGAGILAASGLSCDFNALNLLPPETEATVYQLRMQEESDFQMTCAMAVAPDLESLRRLTERLDALPLAGRVDSLARMIPEGQEGKLELLAAFRPYLEGWRITYRSAPGADYPALLAALRERLEEVQEAAFGAGMGELVKEIESLFGPLASVRSALEGPGKDEARRRTADFERALFGVLEELSGLVERWLRAEPFTEESLPPELLARFRSPRGNYVAYVYPEGAIWDVDFLEKFVAELRTAAENPTGFPVTHLWTVRRMTRGLVEALAYALGIIIILLALDFRRPLPVALSLLPLVLGALWVQVWMLLLGRSYDFASLPALPLLLGLGVVYGVHLVRRWLEDPALSAFAAVSTSGRAVAFAALTTIAGLFGLLFSRHRGVASFGIVLMLGILSCLLAALFVLPALIDLLKGRPKADENRLKAED